MAVYWPFLDRRNIAASRRRASQGKLLCPIRLLNSAETLRINRMQSDTNQSDKLKKIAAALAPHARALAFAKLPATPPPPSRTAPNQRGTASPPMAGALAGALAILPRISAHIPVTHTGTHTGYSEIDTPYRYIRGLAGVSRPFLSRIRADAAASRAVAKVCSKQTPAGAPPA